MRNSDLLLTAIVGGLLWNWLDVISKSNSALLKKIPKGTRAASITLIRAPIPEQLPPFEDVRTTIVYR